MVLHFLNCYGSTRYLCNSITREISSTGRGIGSDIYTKKGGNAFIIRPFTSLIAGFVRGRFLFIKKHSFYFEGV